MTCNKAIRVAKGETYPYAAFLDADPLVYKPISTKVSDTPLRLTVAAHGLPASWPILLTDVGYDDLEVDVVAGKLDAGDEDWFEATVVDANTIELNDIDLARLDGTWNDGKIAYRTPVSLAGASARFVIYDQSDNELVSIDATLDDSAKTITAAIDTADIDIGEYRFALIVTDAADAVSVEDGGAFIVEPPGTVCH